MTDLPERINRHLTNVPYSDIGEALSQARELLRDCVTELSALRARCARLSAQLDQAGAMTDTRIAQDYLNTLFANLAAGDLDPARVDWPFAAEAWQAVRGEVERLRGERGEVQALYRQTLAEAQWLRAERDELCHALVKSLKFQSHYAELLNTYDGGERRVFADVQAWLDRLNELREAC